MTPSPPDLEAARLKALASYDILDSLPDEDYDAITRIASQICRTPISMITLLDEQRQWFKSAIGLSQRETPRNQAFCAHAIQTPHQLMEVPDARLDERFIGNPLTTGEPRIVFYAGAPLVDESGHALGTLCVIDNKPNKLTDEQATTLKVLARQVVTLLQLRRSQAALKEANQKLQRLNEDLEDGNRVLQTVVDNCPAGLVLWQAVRKAGKIVDFQYVLTNSFNGGVTGFPVEHMIGNTLKNLFPNVGSSSIINRLTTAVETGQRQRFQQYDKFDQIDMWGDYSLVPLGDRVLLAYQDITQIKKNEEQLRTYSENLEQLVSERTSEISQLSALQNAILEYAGFAIISTNTAGVIQTVNPATLRMFGYSADALIGQRTILSLYAPAALEDKARLLSERLGRPVPVNFDLFTFLPDEKGYECIMVDNKGEQIPTFLITTPLRDKAETVIGYVFMATDITTLKTTRAELQRRNQELNTFFEVALDLHCIAHANGTILKTNRAWQTTLGYTASELLTMNHFDLVHPNDREATQIVVGLATPHHRNINHINRFRRKDGLYRVIEWNVVAIDELLYASARDITDRQQSEKQLKRANQRLQLATQAANQGIWEYNREQNLLTWDERMFAIHGLNYSELPLLLEDYEQLIHPDDLPAFQQRHLVNSGPLNTRFVNERRIVRPDGVIRHTELHGIRIINKAGQSTGSVGVVRDITERKDAEFALRRSEERYRSLVDNLKEVVFQANLQGEWTFLNPFWTAMIGYSIAESLGKPFYAYVSVKDQVKNYDLYKEFIANRRTFSRLVVRYQHKNGKYRWASVFAQTMIDDAGQPMGITGTITDITEQKQAMDALRKSEQRFRDIAENINEIFWIHSVQPFQLLYINPAYERVSGLSSKSLYADPHAFLELVVDEDKPAMSTALQQYLQGKELTVQFRAKNTPGLLRWFSIRTFVKKSNTGVPISYIGIANDITSQKEKELVLQQSLAREQELNRLKSQFVSTASHEFRTPLATIQSSVDLIKLYIDRPAPTAHTAIQRHLGIIEKEITNFSDLLADILTLGKIEAGKVPLTLQWVDMQALATSVISTHFGERTDKRTVIVAVTGSPRLIYADEKLISHALVNLLSNAFKFSADNPELILIFTESAFSLVVTDRGIGIPADELTHLFETFFRARNATNIQGSGLGLVITRQFVEKHGGHLDIQSRENVGTTCTITLPN